MALRDQPYLPLYIQDFLTDEKLAFCSAAATGVYIRIMCLMHKSEEYGKILLKQKFKQSDKPLKNFASQLAIQMPYDYNTILCALEELIDSKVLSEEPFALIQKRMVKDNEISELRALSGKKGGLKSIKKKQVEKDDFALNFAQAKNQANTEYENEYENKDDIEEKEIIGKKEIKSEFEKFRKAYPGNKRGFETEFENFKKKNSNYAEIVFFLLPALEKLIEWRNNKKNEKQFVPEFANLQTWINQRRWEDELEKIENSKPKHPAASYQPTTGTDERF